MGSKSYISTQTISAPADQRVQLETIGAGSQFVSPAATVANPGAVAGSVGSYSQLTQNWSQVGMDSASIRQMLLDQQVGATESLGKVTQLSTAAIEASTAALGTLSTSSSSALGTLAAAKTGEPTDWQKYIPYAIVAVIVIAMAKNRRSA